MTDSVVALAAGRRVTLLPCSGGPSWGGTVRVWDTVEDHVVADIGTKPDAVSSLDHHQVWLSTVTREGDEHGITIFSGRALAIDHESLRLDGAVRLAHDRRRRAVRAAGVLVTLPPWEGVQRQVTASDVSRGGVRLPIVDGGWAYDDPVDLVLHLDEAQEINLVGWLMRIDVDTMSVVLRLDELPIGDAEAIDRFVLAQLPIPTPPPPPPPPPPP